MSTIKLSKEYGDILISGDVLQEHKGRIIPITLGIDLALCGGLLEGTTTVIAGKSGFGKTTLCLTIATNAQKMDKTVYYMDVENRLQLSLMKTIPGLNIEKLQIIRPTKDKFLVAEDYLNIMLDILKADEGCVIIVDSIANFCTNNALGKKIGEGKKLAEIPSLMYEFFRQASQIIQVMKSNVIFITHTQANPSPYGGPVEMGGNAQQFLSSNRLLCLSSKEIPDEMPKTGRNSIFKINKSALGPSGGEAIVPIRYGFGVDKYEDIYSCAEEMGLIIHKGAWYTINLPEYSELKLQGKNSVLDNMKSDPKMSDMLERNIRELILGKE